jgi:hypothetical protein
MSLAIKGLALPSAPAALEDSGARSFAPGTTPVLSPAEPVSPELVLVSPELREAALARLREFPSAARTPVEERLWRYQELRPSSARPARRGRRVAVVATAIAGAVVAAAALGQAIAGDGPRQSERSPSAPREGGTAPTPAPVPPPVRAPTRRAGDRAKTPGETKRPSAKPRHEGRERGRAGVAAGSSPLHSRVQAERNVLQSPRFFLTSGRRAAVVVDAATGIFRTNTRVSCAASPPAAAQAHVFVCSVRHGKTRLRVRYTATGKKSFRLALD